MRVLGIGSYNDFGSLYLTLQREGHDVRVHISEPNARDVLAGMVTLAPSWEAELPWIRDGDGLIVFEDAGRGADQDRLRRDGYRVIGGSAIGDQLEQDRARGQQVLRSAGMQTAPAHVFDAFADAIAFIRRVPDRYVLKFDGSDLPSNLNYVGARDDGADVIAMLTKHARGWSYGAPRFILMQHIQGIETGFGAFFNGREFVGPANLDWEHKRLFPGDLGELTGEMGTVVTYRDSEKLFAILEPLAPVLREAGHVGYVNLNTIINERGVWPLELTMRFGYPGFAILSALFAEPAGDVLARIARGDATPVATHDGFAVGVVLTMPPFPHDQGYDELSKGTPILLPDDLTDEERAHIHLGEVALDEGALVAAGIIGYTMVVTGRGSTIEQAQRAAYGLARRIAIPNVRYRNDIGDSLRDGGWSQLAKLGWVPATPSSRR